MLHQHGLLCVHARASAVFRAMRTSGWARFDKAPSWIPTAAAKTSFRIAFSASEPVICSANVDFVDAAAIVCFHAVIVGVSGDPRVARRRPYRAGLSAKYRGSLSGLIDTDSSEWMSPSAPVHARA